MQTRSLPVPPPPPNPPPTPTTTPPSTEPTSPPQDPHQQMTTTGSLSVTINEDELSLVNRHGLEEEYVDEIRCEEEDTATPNEPLPTLSTPTSNSAPPPPTPLSTPLPNSNQPPPPTMRCNAMRANLGAI